MAWQIESEHVDLAEMAHVTVLVNPDIITRDGTPARHEDHILLGTHGLSTTRGLGSSNFTLAADGTLKDADGNEVDPRKRHADLIQQLEAIASAGRAYARKHNKAVFTGKRK